MRSRVWQMGEGRLGCFRRICALSAALLAVLGPRQAGAVDINTSSTFSSNATWNEQMNISTTAIGSVTQTAGEVRIYARLNVGTNQRGSYLLSSGTLYSSDTYIGATSGAAGSTFTQTGGYFNPFSLRVDNSSTFDISGGSTRFNNLTLGGNGTTGFVRQSGGSVTTGGIVMSNSPSSAYLMTGGTLSATYLGITSGTASFTGGSVNFSSYVDINQLGAATVKQFIVGNNVAPASVGSLRSAYTLAQVRLANTGGGTALVIGSDGTSTTYSGFIEDYDATRTGGIEKIGTGTLTLSGSSSYSGGTIIRGGAIAFNLALSLGTGKITLDNGNLIWAGGNTADISGRLNLGAGGGTLTNSGPEITLASVISGSGGLRIAGGGTIRLSGINTYTGGTVVQESQLYLLANSGSLGTIRGDLVGAYSTIYSEASNSIGYADGAKVDKVTLYYSTLRHSASAADFGWGVDYTLVESLMSSNGGVASATASSKFAFGRNTSVFVDGNALSRIAGRIDLRSDFNPNTNFTVQAGSTLDILATITSSGQSTGLTGFTKLGLGTMVLSSSNSYLGTTFVKAGTLRVAASQGLGASTSQVVVSGGTLLVDHGVAVANSVTLSGGSYARVSSGSLAGTMTSTSDLDAFDTKAQLLGGTLSGTSTLLTSFTATSAASNDGMRTSDVYTLEGTGTNTYVLQLSIADGIEPYSYLGWLDEDNAWVRAVDGNSGGTPLFILGAYNPAQHFHLGYYGLDTATGSAWAVLNHNSQFAIVPEPHTLLLAGLGACILLQTRRRRGGTPTNSPA